MSLTLVLVLSFTVADFVGAFTEPGSAFPGGAPAAPLDTGSLFQTKSGGLEVDTLGVNTTPVGYTFEVLGTSRVSGAGEFGGELSIESGDLLLKAGSLRLYGALYDTYGGGDDYYLDLDVDGNLKALNIENDLDVGGDVTANAFIGDGSGLTGLPVSSQWTATTTGIYYDGGHVAIGTAGDPGTYELYVQGQTFSTAGWESSDSRLKKNVAGMTNVLNKVLNLTGVYYDWRTKEYPDRGLPEGRQIGLIAQDVEKVFPELVNTDGDGYKALAYDKLTAVLLEAIKEQQAQIETLNARLEALEN